MVSVLVDQNAEINIRDELGTTPLCMAVRYGNKEMVRLLLANNADTDLQDGFGRTPQNLAVKKCDLKMIELIQSKKGHSRT